MRLGTNIPRVAGFNERVVIDALRRRPGISQTELAELTGLAVPTIAGIVRQLLSQEVIEAIGAQAGSRGRPRIALAVNGAAGFGLGVHLDPAQVTVTLLDLAGRAREVVLETGALTHDPDGGVAHLAELVQRMLGDAGVDRSRVIGIGVAAPGPIDVPGGRLIDPPWLPGWAGYPLAQRISQALHLDVLFEKDTVAAITGERWLRTDEDDGSTMIFVYQGIGLGFGLAAGGRVLRGVSGNTGEVGGLLGGSAPDGIPSRGRVDPATLCAQAVERGAPEVAAAWGAPPATLPEVDRIEAAFRVLCAGAAIGDETCLSVLDEAGHVVAQAVCPVADLLDAERVVLGGPYGDLVAPFYLPLLRRAVDRDRPGAAPHRVSVSASVMGARAGAIGAAAMVLDDRYVPHASALAPA